MNTGDKRKSIDDLIEVMAALRTPETGCPWDLKQTFATIAPYTVEEAYEVADAIERNDLADLKEELGDLLLQVVYHARLAQEQNAFEFEDIADAITNKMIRRHPHVFGDAETRAKGAAKGFWETIKAQEKAERANIAGHAAQERPASILDDVPAAMPGMTRAVKLQARAAKAKFDWPHISHVFEKVHEELVELQEAITKHSDDRDHVEEEFGDLLFVMANIGRHLKIDPEKALRGANQKFIRRFHYIEEKLAEMGRTPDQSNLEEMDALWDEAKAAERNQ